MCLQSQAQSNFLCQIFICRQELKEKQEAEEFERRKERGLVPRNRFKPTVQCGESVIFFFGLGRPLRTRAMIFNTEHLSLTRLFWKNPADFRFEFAMLGVNSVIFYQNDVFANHFVENNVSHASAQSHFLLPRAPPKDHILIIRAVFWGVSIIFFLLYTQYTYVPNLEWGLVYIFFWRFVFCGHTNWESLLSRISICT